MKLATIVLVAFAHDVGFGPDVPLRYAESDASRFVETMSSVGHVDRVHPVIGGDAKDIQRALHNAARDVADAQGLGRNALLIFYYSGHADGDYLRAGGTRLTWTKLNGLIEQANADLTLAIIDACDSGAAIGRKGGALAPPFSTRDFGPASVRGKMWITSSRDDEASYESDEIGGSFFSHFLVSGLRGAADLDEDGRVTLTEAYDFTFDRTVSETSMRLRRAQHPTYRSDLEGEGRVVLSAPIRSSTSLVLPREAEGRWFLARRFGVRRSVLEVPKRHGTLIRMSVSAGRYLVYKKESDRILLTEVVVGEHDEVVVDPDKLRAYRYRDVMQKGGGVSVLDWNLRGGVTLTSPTVDGASRYVQGRAALSVRGAVFGASAALSAGRHTFRALDSDVANEVLVLDVVGELVYDAGAVTVVGSVGPSLLFLGQHTTNDDFHSGSIGAGAGVVIERHVASFLSAYVEIGARAFVLRGERTFSLEPSVFGGAGLSFAL